MTTFSKDNFVTLNYEKHRPHYPSSFYRNLANFATRNGHSVNKAIDLGCGTGVATFPLLNFANVVYGVDLSAKMISTANSLVEERCKEMGSVSSDRIKFITGSAESIVNGEDKDNIINDGSVDLIAAAQCIHWFQDYPSFFKAIAKLLTPGGTLAFWYYLDPVVIDYSGSENDSEETKLAKLERSSEITFKYMHNDPNFAGPHWEQPGRSILRDHYDEVNAAIPKEYFTDITRNKFVPNLKGKSLPNVDNEQDLDMVLRGIKVTVVRDYLATYSGYHNYKDANGDKAVDIPQQILNDWEMELGWNSETKIDYVFQTGYTFLRKK